MASDSALPNGAPSFPEDYNKFISLLKRPAVFPQGLLYQFPKDPMPTLGRRGDENFAYSMLIGEFGNLFILLTYLPPKAYESPVWSYRICNSAEWDVAAQFNTLDELTAFLNERP